MNRRDFIKSTSASAAAIATVPTVIASEVEDFTPKPNRKYLYFVNCYIQNQKFWPLEEYKRGSFKNGKLYFGSFQKAVDFVDIHSLVTPFYNEISYEIFHEISEDVMVAPKHIFTYWVKIKKGEAPETIRWIRPDYIDQTADGALIEYVQ
tara:strand:- start:2337 stop:2786 length:450 start_codon:yes stop_codon:yes gene_type:complete